MKKIIMLGLIGLFIAGCQNLGNDKLDLVVDVVFVDHAGQEYTAALGPDGLTITGQYRSLRTGNLYVLSEDGFEIQSPNGTRVKVKAVE